MGTYSEVILGTFITVIIISKGKPLLESYYNSGFAQSYMNMNQVKFAVSELVVT